VLTELPTVAVCIARTQSVTQMRHANAPRKTITQTHSSG
jgi:hypothetical protein